MLSKLSAPRPWIVILAMQCLFVGLQVPRILAPAAFGYDEGVYWQTLLNMAQGHALYSEIFYSQLPGFAYIALLFAGITEPQLWAARMGCVVMASCLIPASAWIAFQVGTARWALLAAAATAASPMLWAHAPRLAGNTPAAAFLAVSIGCFVKASQSGKFRWRWGIAAMFVLALSVQLKPITVPGGLVAAMLLAVRLGRRAWMPIVVTAMLGIGTTAMSLVAADPGGHFLSQLQAGSLAGDEGPVAVLDLGQKFEALVRGNWANDTRSNRLLMPLLVALSFVIALRIHEARPMLLGIWGALALMVLPVLVHPTGRPHHFLAALPAATLLVAFHVATIWRERARLPPLLRAAALIFMGVTAANEVRVSARVASSSLRARQPSALGAVLAREFRPDRDVVVGEVQFELARAGFVVPPWWVDTSRTRFAAGSLTCDGMLESLTTLEIDGIIVGPRASAIDCGLSQLEERLRTIFGRAERVGGWAIFLERVKSDRKAP